MIDFETMLQHQRAFNELVWKKRTIQQDERGVIDRLRHLSLGMIEECLEFLRTYDYKSHRRQKLRLQNVAHSHEELTDQFKYWLSVADVAEYPFERLEELYYAKSRVVQYRFQEEWLKNISGISAVIDIDEVLADYIGGICAWAREHCASLLSLSGPDRVRLCGRLDELQSNRMWVDHTSVGLSHMEWQKIKHHFRTNGGKATMPVFNDAKPFLDWCRKEGLQIILLTSRPVTDYPNILTDTITWLHKNDLPFDYLWWTTEKTERLEEASIEMRSTIRFAVDDNARYVGQFSSKGVATYWLVRGKLPASNGDRVPDNVTIVSSLTEVLKKEMGI